MDISKIKKVKKVEGIDNCQKMLDDGWILLDARLSTTQGYANAHFILGRPTNELVIQPRPKQHTTAELLMSSWPRINGKPMDGKVLNCPNDRVYNPENPDCMTCPEKRICITILDNSKLRQESKLRTLKW